MRHAIASAELIFVSVNTPTKTRGLGAGCAADLQYVEAATRRIAMLSTTSKIIVEKSTVPCRTAESMRAILDATSPRPGVRFDILSNPEFLAEGTAVENLLKPDRILIGALNTEGGRLAQARLAHVYAGWVDRSAIITTGLWSSELTKLASNALLAQRVSSINSLAAICEQTGADIDEVARGCGKDSRLGPLFLKAGLGFGGSCFQKVSPGERRELRAQLTGAAMTGHSQFGVPRRDLFPAARGGLLASSVGDERVDKGFLFAHHCPSHVFDGQQQEDCECV